MSSTSNTERPIVWKKSEKFKQKEHLPGHKKYQNIISDDPDAPEKLGFLAGHQIFEARNQKRMTQSELARKINVHANVIRDYECGVVVPNREIIKKLNRELGIKINLN